MKASTMVYAWRLDITRRIRTFWRRFRWCVVRLMLTTDERGVMYHDICEQDDKDSHYATYTRGHALPISDDYASVLRRHIIELIAP
jgi:hypothetical protein